MLGPEVACIHGFLTNYIFLHLQSDFKGMKLFDSFNSQKQVRQTEGQCVISQIMPVAILNCSEHNLFVDFYAKETTRIKL
jgi:hypothetical protein